MRAFLDGEPLPGLTDRPAGEGVNGGAGYSSTMKTLARLLALFYAYQYKGGYGPLTLPEIDEILEKARPCFLASITLSARAAGETGEVDLSDFPELRQQFRDLLAHMGREAERAGLERGLAAPIFRDARDHELDLRRGIGLPAKRKPGRPPEPEEVRIAKERARVEAKEKAAAERRRVREAKAEERRRERAKGALARQMEALFARQDATRAELTAIEAEIETLKKEALAQPEAVE